MPSDCDLLGAETCPLVSSDERNHARPAAPGFFPRVPPSQPACAPPVKAGILAPLSPAILPAFPPALSTCNHLSRKLGAGGGAGPVAPQLPRQAPLLETSRLETVGCEAREKEQHSISIFLSGRHSWVSGKVARFTSALPAAPFSPPLRAESASRGLEGRI